MQSRRRRVTQHYPNLNLKGQLRKGVASLQALQRHYHKGEEVVCVPQPWYFRHFGYHRQGETSRSHERIHKEWT